MPKRAAEALWVRFGSERFGTVRIGSDAEIGKNSKSGTAKEDELTIKRVSGEKSGGKNLEADNKVRGGWVK